MDYNKLYNRIITRALDRKPEGYTERHHIIPRFVGGDDSETNLVRLTAREHFICHWILTKIYPSGNMHNRAIHAFAMMAWCSTAEQDRLRCGSRLYEKLRKSLSDIKRVQQRGEGNSQYGSRWIYNEESLQTKKITNDEELPPGWEYGRVTHWDKFFEKRAKAEIRKNKVSINCLTGREEEFYRIYDETGSLNTTLKSMGLLGAVGGIYYFAKALLDIRDKKAHEANN